MRMHYLMWVAMAIFFIGFGIISRGREDIVEHTKYEEGYEQGAWMFLKNQSPKELGEINI